MVRSLAGRDKGRLFFVLSTDGCYAALSDGKVRRVGRPKRKKRKHFELVGHPDCHVADKIRSGADVLDSELRRELAIYGQAIQEDE